MVWLLPLSKNLPVRLVADKFSADEDRSIDAEIAFQLRQKRLWDNRLIGNTCLGLISGNENVPDSADLLEVQAELHARKVF
jgi:hypothetical protein